MYNELVNSLRPAQAESYWAPQKNLVKGCRGTLDCYYLRCELFSAAIADTLLFVNILVSGIFHGRFAQGLVVTKPCLQICYRSRQQLTTCAITVQCLTATSYLNYMCDLVHICDRIWREFSVAEQRTKKRMPLAVFSSKNVTLAFITKQRMLFCIGQWERAASLVKEEGERESEGEPCCPSYCVIGFVCFPLHIARTCFDSSTPLKT